MTTVEKRTPPLTGAAPSAPDAAVRTKRAPAVGTSDPPMRRRVIVIGGGLAGLTTAFELSRTPAARDEWETTVFEMGHKLGGRLFSAHRPEAWGRNEEHGLHVWFGFYDNAFRLAEEVWASVKKPEGCPWKSIWDGLRPIHVSDHGLPNGDDYVVKRVFHSRTSDRPGRLDQPMSWHGRLTALLDKTRTVPSTLRSFLGESRHTPPAADLLGEALWPTPGQESPLHALERALAPILRRVIAIGAQDEATRAGRRRSWARVERLLGRLHRPLIARLRRASGEDPAATELVDYVDVVLAMARGVTSEEHGICEDGDLDRVSGWDLRAWLAHHGAAAETVERCRVLEFYYDGPFAYLGGDRSRPVLEASTALRFAYRFSFGYKHAVAHLLSRGAGETLVAPLVSVLRDRGVRFRFFHRLERIEIDPESKRVKRLVFVRAARAKETYDPLLVHDGLLGLRADPDWSAIDGGEALAERKVEFYSRFARDRGETDEVALEVDRDFDDVVLALPLGSVAPDPDGFSPVAGWLEAHPPARACLEKLHLVPTVAAQLWFREPADAIDLKDRALVTWATPLSILCDMSPVIAHERWPTPVPSSCAYLCGAWPFESVAAPAADGEAPARDLARIREMVREQIARHGSSFLASTATLNAPSGLADPFDAQYVRVNVEPWDLADLPLPGADAVRLEATDSGMRNLALAGAWVRTTMNATSIEAAVSSGIAAARALGAEVRPILAETLLRHASPRPVLPGRTLRAAGGLDATTLR